MSLLVAPVAAGAAVDIDGALRDYAQGRLADGDGADASAIASYRAALDHDPGELTIARRSYVQAMEGGDSVLALRSAALLDASGIMPRDGTLLHIGEALRRRDWATALHWTDRMAQEGNFAFLAPLVRSWISLGQGQYAAPVIDTNDKALALALRYVDEHSALQALARNDLATARPAMERAIAIRGNDDAPLRLIFAAQLASAGHKDDALALLPDRADFAAARASIGRGKTLAVTTPAQGFAILLARLAVDVSSEKAGAAIALRLARMATFTDPSGAEARLVTARLLTAQDRSANALAEARRVQDRGWFGPLARVAAIRAMATGGDFDAALPLAQAAAQAPQAGPERQVLLGQLLASKGDFDGAATAFQAARALYPAGKAPWAILLMQGSALDEAQRWDEARQVLEQAVAIAPEEASLLNYLGYAQIERRQNMTAALALLQKAAALRPKDASITDSLGWAHYLTGDVAMAVPVLEQAAAAAPTDVTINEHLGDALWSAGRRFEARYAWAAASVFADGKAAERLAAKSREGMKPAYEAP